MEPLTELFPAIDRDLSPLGVSFVSSPKLCKVRAPQDKAGPW